MLDQGDQQLILMMNILERVDVELGLLRQYMGSMPENR